MQMNYEHVAKAASPAELTVVRQQLQMQGYFVFEVPVRVLTDSLVQLSAQLGVPVPSRSGTEILQLLRPMDTFGGHSNSLTSRFGTGSFPMHTDTAHWRRPVRYVILGCKNAGKGGRETILLRWNDLKLTESELDDASNGVFLIRRHDKSFLAPILDRRLALLRLDFECMFPKGSVAKRAMGSVQRAIELAEKTHVRWTPGMICVIDNWNVFHCRSESLREDGDRELLRILVEEVRDGKTASV